MIITKMALPRRTFLRGVGVTLALPLLDAMVPALIGVAADGRETGSSLRVLLHAERRGDEPHRRELLEAQDRGRGLRVLADSEAARAVPESGDRGERAAQSFGREPRRRQRRPHAQHRLVADRNAHQANRRVRSARRASRSIRSSRRRSAGRRRCRRSSSRFCPTP